MEKHCDNTNNKYLAAKIFVKIVTAAAVIFLFSSCSAFKLGGGVDLEKQIERQQAGQELAAAAPGKSDLTAAEYENTGDSYLVKGDINRAYYYYIKGLTKEPDNTSLLHKQGTLLLKKKRFVEAEPVYARLLSINHRDAKALEGMARVYFGQGKFKEAKYNFREALKILPDLYLSHEYMGLIHSKDQQYEKAIDRFESALSYQPENVGISNNLAVTYYLNGNYQSAVRLFTDLARVSNNQKIYNNLALSYFQQGLYEEALDAFKKGAEHEAIAYNNMGYEFLTTKQYLQAVKSFERAITLYPQYYPMAQKNLAIAKKEMVSAGINSSR